jgi:hypothetical protein
MEIYMLATNFRRISRNLDPHPPLCGGLSLTGRGEDPARKFGIGLIVFALIFCAATARAQMPATALSIAGTKVIRFAPKVPSGDVQEGSCWTESIAAPRAGAWRCSVGNAISDPCFTVAGNRQQLVCGADPALQSDGFVLKLTQPLPKSSLAHDRKAEPWIFQLSDGSICEAMTGTLSPVNGEPARWTCALHNRDQIRPRGLVTALTPGKIWMADKFPESAIGTQGAVPEKVPVRIIWE